MDKKKLEKSESSKTNKMLKRIEEYNLDPKECNHCGKKIDYKKRRQKFCSMSCSAKENNKGRRRHGEEPSNCKNCGKKLKIAKMKYCSSSCQFDYQWVHLKEKIRAGDYDKKWAGSRVLRRFLVEERGEKCEQCSLKEWQGKAIPLNVHHIDGDAGNNLPSNLKLLCLNCHGLTDNFGSKNKKSTRNYRYKAK